jgi:hypothetical protein
MPVEPLQHWHGSPEPPKFEDKDTDEVKLEKLRSSIEDLCWWVKYIGTGLEYHTTGWIHGFIPEEERFLIVERPAETIEVMNAIRRVQRDLFVAEIPVWIDELGTSTPSDGLLNFLSDKMNYYAKNPDEYRRFCVPKQHLEQMLRLRHEKRKPVTDHLQHIKKIVAFEEEGKEFRYGINYWDLFFFWMDILEPTEMIMGRGRKRTYHLERLLPHLKE